jgi:hypothetical protein
MKTQTALLLLFVSLILTCEIYSNCHDCTVNSCSKNSNTSKFKAWCSFENKCSKNETNCKNFELFYFSDNYTHSAISKKKIIELLEPERNPKYDKENYWKNYKNWNFPLSCENQKFISNVSKCPFFESNFSKLIKKFNLVYLTTSRLST